MSLTSSPLTLRDVFTALGDEAPPYGGGIAFSGVSTDSRTIQPGELFVALVNEKSDGHTFVMQAISAGAAGVIITNTVPVSRDIPMIRVADTQAAYGQIARFWRDQFEIPVVGVTGSVGKTTVKEMLAAALSPLGSILKTEASQNNETGVPKALLQLTPDHRAAVVEMGMRGEGQIAYLCEIARPTAGLITIIGDAHIEMLGARDAIADAKGELLEALPKTGFAVLNAADPYLPILSAKSPARVVTFSGDAAFPADYQATEMTRTETGWRFQVQGIPVELTSPSRHDISNAVAALAAASELGVPLAEAVSSLSAYNQPPMRMQIIHAAWGGVIINDAYNAAPSSVQSALETLKSYPGGRKLAFLGDMRELGAQAIAAHRDLGAIIDSLGGVDALYTVGGLAAQIPGATTRFADSTEAAVFVQKALHLRSTDVILVKGSRAIAMEEVAAALTTWEAGTYGG